MRLVVVTYRVMFLDTGERLGEGDDLVLGCSWRLEWLSWFIMMGLTRLMEGRRDLRPPSPPSSSGRFSCCSGTTATVTCELVTNVFPDESGTYLP